MTSTGVIVGGKEVLVKRVENSFLIGIPFLGSVAAIWHISTNGMTWIDVSSFFIFYVFVGLGVALGLHRYFSHRSFEAHPFVVFLLAAGGTMAFQGSIARWVADHRRHHAHTDEAGDVHSPYVDPWGLDHRGIRGFLYAHIGWMFDNTATNFEIYGRGLNDNKAVAFFTRTHFFWLFLSIALPFLYGLVLGGLEAAITSMLIGGFLRTTLLHNVVWAVNSVGHTFGSRNFFGHDRSTNNLPLAILTFGDGWHNNHHKYPRSYRHGLKSNEIDINGMIIDFLERLGLAWDVVRISKERVRTDISKSEQLDR